MRFAISGPIAPKDSESVTMTDSAPACPKCRSTNLTLTGYSPNYPRITPDVGEQPTNYTVGYKCEACGLGFTENSKEQPRALQTAS